ncbi:hypothetical protein FRB97_003312 [Tulasnella sp. 331]|nr:hypothetical protein FRB97_003312 [Tulasnella sp. 331]
MLVSGGFRSSIPLPQSGVNFSQLDRDVALKWARQQNGLGEILLSVLHGRDDSPYRRRLVKRPFMCYLCVGVVWRALELWKLDNTLTLAVDVAVKFRDIVNWYESIWPCAEIRRWTAKAVGDLEFIQASTSTPVV